MPDLPPNVPPITMEDVAPTKNVRDDLVRLADAMQDVGARVVTDGREPIAALTEVTVERIPGATCASVTVLRAGRFRTEGPTSEVARHADELQYEVGSGPCVDAVLDDNVYVTGDASRDERWSEWGTRARAATGVVSVLSFRLAMLDDTDAISCLNVYSDAPDAFGDRDLGTGLVLATHGSALVTALLARDEAANLRAALESNREIGVAMGILMQMHRLSRAQAFDVLRVASQDANRKLVDIATELADTGVLAIKRWPAGSPDG